MPAQQHGSVIKRGVKYQARWFDADGNRRAKNFRTQSEAKAHLQDEIRRVAKQRRGEVARDCPATVEALVELFLASYQDKVDRASFRTVESNLRHIRAEFGWRNPVSLRSIELDEWRATISSGVRHDVFRRTRQMFRWAVGHGLMERNPTDGIKNSALTRDGRRPINVFENWADVERVSEEMDYRYAAIPVVLVDTGLRPEELFGLNVSDVDWERREFTVRQRWTQGLLKPGTKQKGVRSRKVPFTQRTYDALRVHVATHPALRPTSNVVELFAGASAPDDRPLFPAARGGRPHNGEFHFVVWKPAFRAAGLEHHTPYDCRHTAITWALSAGVPASKVAKVYGTSIKQIEATYSHVIPSDLDDFRARLEAFAAAQAVGAVSV